MKKVKCRYCGAMIDKDKAYAVRHGRVNWYYCNEEHSTSKTPKDLFYTKVAGLIRTTHTVFYKEMEEIASVHGYEKMTAYIETNKEMIEMYMSRSFVSEYAKVRYFSSILRNNLADFVIPKEEEPQVVDYVENTYDTSNFKSKEDKGMDGLLFDLLG